MVKGRKKVFIILINSASINQGFQEIQTELNACLTCLDDGVEEIDFIGRPGSSRSMTESELSATESSIDTQDNHKKQQDRVIDDTNEIAQMDKVFEAFIAQDIDPSFLGFDDDFVTQEEAQKPKKEKKQSNKVLRELESVLDGKQKEWEVSEAKAVARQENVDKEDGNTFDKNEEFNSEPEKNVKDQSTATNGYLSVPTSLLKTNILGTICKLYRIIFKLFYQI